MKFKFILIVSLFITGSNSFAYDAEESEQSQQSGESEQLKPKKETGCRVTSPYSPRISGINGAEDLKGWEDYIKEYEQFESDLISQRKLTEEYYSSFSENFNKEREVQDRELLDLQAKTVPGCRSSKISADLAQQAISSAPEKIKDLVTNIKEGFFEKHEKNVVLYGFPGTGKTTVAKAVAQVCDIPCLLIAAGSLSTEYANSGCVHLREMFKLAKEYGKPCIIAIDELEVLIKKQNEKHGHENSILTTLWQEMDAVQDRENKIVVIFTLNSKKDLPAPMEDRLTEVVVPLPTLKQRERALAYHLKERQVVRGLRYENGVTAINLARKTHDFSQRELEKLLLNATRRGLKKGCLVTNKDFLIAIKEIVNNPARKEAREAGTLRFQAKKYCRENPISIIGTTLSVIGLAMNVYFHTVQVEQNRIGMAHNLAQSAQSLKFVQYQLGLIDKAAVMAIN